MRDTDAAFAKNVSFVQENSNNVILWYYFLSRSAPSYLRRAYPGQGLPTFPSLLSFPIFFLFFTPTMETPY